MAATPTSGEIPEVTAARRLRLEAARQHRLAELATLEQEGRTYAATDRALVLERELAERVANESSKHLAAIARAVADHEAREAEARAAEARFAAVMAHPAVRKAAGTNTLLAEKLAKLVEAGKETRLELEQIEALRYREAHPHREDLHPRLAEFDAQMRGLGFECLCWVETLDYSEQFGGTTLTGVWPHPSGEATLLSTAVAALHVSELETEFSDGRQLITSQGRGRNYFCGGPQVDVLLVDASLPLIEVIELHRARVAHVLTHTPGLALRPWQNAADYRGAQERQRQAKLTYRLAVGMDETEARSVPVNHPEVFVPLVREAALAFVREAQAQRHRVN